MSILNVEHLSHGFGDRAIFQDVSFRMLAGEKPPAIDFWVQVYYSVPRKEYQVIVRCLILKI